MEWLKGRCKELSSLHGGALIAIGCIILFAGPFAKWLHGLQSHGDYGQFGRKTN